MCAVTDIAIAVATVCYAGLTAYLWKENKKSADAAVTVASLTQRTFNATTRPWVGPTRIEAMIEEENRRFTVLLHFKNVGAAPAFNVEAEWDWFIDGMTNPKTRMPRGSTILFPGQEGTLVGKAEGPQYDSLIGRDLQITCDIRYRSTDGQIHTTEERWRFNWEVQEFFVLSGDAT